MKHKCDIVIATSIEKQENPTGMATTFHFHNVWFEDLEVYLDRIAELSADGAIRRVEIKFTPGSDAR